MDRRRFVTSLGAGLTGTGLLAAARAAGEAVPGPVRQVRISTSGPARPFPHYWEAAVGSGRAILALRDSYRRDFHHVHQLTGMQAVRFHGIFHDEVGVYGVDAQQRPVYNFQYVDQIYDGLLELGLRPFVELSFMPQALASGPSTVFWYKGHVAPPKRVSDWTDMVAAYARHCIGRYGAAEVRRWKFEIWNEPNIDFWAGTREQYLDLYKSTALALKAVDRELQVGGPATAQAAWAPEFLDWCARNHAPVDFFSTHIYANDPQKAVFGREAGYSLEQTIPLALEKVRNQVQESPFPHLPVYVTEWNSTYMNDSAINDTAYNASYIAHVIDRCQGLVEGMSFWCGSDVFEEQGVVKEIFYGGYGLFAIHGIAKPSLHAFTLLHRLGHEQLTASGDAVIATRRPNGSLAILLWNLAPRDAQGRPTAGTPVTVQIEIDGGHGQHAAITRVDDQHGSAITAWKAMGSPRYPSREQIEQLRRAGELPSAEHRRLEAGQPITIEIAPHGVALLEVNA